MKAFTLFLAAIPAVLASPYEKRQAASSVSSAAATSSGSAAASGSSSGSPSATSSAAGSMSTPPVCAAACLGHAQAAQFYCPPYDIECFCTNQQIQEYLSSCVNKSCSSTDMQAGSQFINGTCSGYSNSSSSSTTQSASASSGSATIAGSSSSAASTSA